jgi:hypothetical protein
MRCAAAIAACLLLAGCGTKPAPPVPKLGHALVFARTRTGMLVLVLLPLLVLGLLEMASIWRPEAEDRAGPQAS